ncbi:hypothetical protein [Blastococcus saxobsidens]|uniref:Antitoxin Xre/MbcA/ParS-like toxin-binding domain-containing protein n=1 Tax=Blastococcus saxobsidens (strain DD2) TaxID=1146883 RepID=H6RIL3_BLASD|nr:hypothetical protein [Blastococcus saxobsidens]CCG02207.1 conserved protein of unknown function [Blastococcus saxobsidens DD2]
MTALTAHSIATLTGAMASKVAAQCLNLRRKTGQPDPFVVAVAARDAEEAAELTDLLHVLYLSIRDAHSTREEVLRALLPAGRLTMSPAVLEQVQRNAQAQAELADEFGLLSSTQVAELTGSTASNRAATANRLRNQRKAFAVEVDGAQRFPGFQFGGNGRPRPVIADVLAAVGDRLSGWELALWFTGSSDWLGGERPVDVLDSDSELVVEAARRLADEILT